MGRICSWELLLLPQRDVVEDLLVVGRAVLLVQLKVFVRLELELQLRMGVAVAVAVSVRVAMGLSVQVEVIQVGGELLGSRLVGPRIEGHAGVEGGRGRGGTRGGAGHPDGGQSDRCQVAVQGYRRQGLVRELLALQLLLLLEGIRGRRRGGRGAASVLIVQVGGAAGAAAGAVAAGLVQAELQLGHGTGTGVAGTSVEVVHEVLQAPYVLHGNAQGVHLGDLLVRPSAAALGQIGDDGLWDVLPQPGEAVVHLLDPVPLPGVPPLDTLRLVHVVRRRRRAGRAGGRSLGGDGARARA